MPAAVTWLIATFKAMIVGFRRPGPYVFFDISAVLLELLLFERLVRDFEHFWLHTYIFAYLFFLAGIWLKRYDARYQAGLRIIRSGGSRLAFWLPFCVYFLGMVLPAFAIASGLNLLGYRQAVPPAVGVPLFLGSLVGYPLLFYCAVWRRSAPGRPLPPERGLLPLTGRYLSFLGLFGVSLYMLSFVYSRINKLTQESISWWASPFVLLALALLYFLIYLPGRIHLLVENPGDRANAGWMVLAALAMAGAAFFR